MSGLVSRLDSLQSLLFAVCLSSVPVYGCVCTYSVILLNVTSAATVCTLILIVVASKPSAAFTCRACPPACVCACLCLCLIVSVSACVCARLCLCPLMSVCACVCLCRCLPASASACVCVSLCLCLLVAASACTPCTRVCFWVCMLDPVPVFFLCVCVGPPFLL